MPEGRVDLCELLVNIKNRKPREGFEEECKSVIVCLENTKTNGDNHLPVRFRLKFAIGALAQGVIVKIVTESEYRQAVICGINL